MLELDLHVGGTMMGSHDLCVVDPQCVANGVGQPVRVEARSIGEGGAVLFPGLCSAPSERQK